MVNPSSSRSGRQRGSLHIEMLVAIALLVGALFPIAYSFASENRLARVCYERAVAMEIVDGEMEVLAAGEWRAFAEGRHELKPAANAANNLPLGHFILTREANRVRLEWLPDRGRKMAREIKVP